MNQIFDINRSIALLKLYYFQNRKAIFLTIAGFFGFIFITSFFVARANPDLLNNMHAIFYFIFLYGGVTVMAGSAYRHLNSSEKSIAGLSLPASTFEKFLIPWLTTGIAWAIFAIGSYIAVSILFNGLWSVVFSFPFDSFNPLHNKLIQHSLHEAYLPYFTIHSAFFLGAAAFKKHAIPKTFLTGFIINSLFTFFNLFLVIFLFGGFESFGIRMASVYQHEQYGDLLTRTIPDLVKYSFVYIIPVIFYLTAFLKLKEREV